MMNLRVILGLILGYHILSSKAIVRYKLLVLEELGLRWILLSILSWSCALVIVLARYGLVPLRLLGHEMVLLRQILIALRPLFLVV